MTQVFKKQRRKLFELDEAKSMKILREKWGSKTEERMNQVRYIVQNYATPQQKRLMERTKIGNDPTTIIRIYEEIVEPAQKLADPKNAGSATYNAMVERAEADAIQTWNRITSDTQARFVEAFGPIDALDGDVVVLDSDDDEKEDEDEGAMPDVYEFDDEGYVQRNDDDDDDNGDVDDGPTLDPDTGLPMLNYPSMDK
jgi:hypothetical protein